MGIEVKSMAQFLDSKIGERTVEDWRISIANDVFSRALRLFGFAENPGETQAERTLRINRITRKSDFEPVYDALMIDRAETDPVVAQAFPEYITRALFWSKEDRDRLLELANSGTFNKRVQASPNVSITERVRNIFRRQSH